MSSRIAWENNEVGKGYQSKGVVRQRTAESSAPVKYVNMSQPSLTPVVMAGCDSDRKRPREAVNESEHGKKAAKKEKNEKKEKAEKRATKEAAAAKKTKEARNQKLA